ncbi:glucose-6-phosphate isomerase [Candidatus Pelagibacter sp. HIMB1495]|uniref:glucose-6-phosphate isomerase n=1 Tax=unclassified Candidatus Pelagibacter TaxID=2647897 RepID=UPI003F8509F2
MLTSGVNFINYKKKLKNKNIKKHLVDLINKNSPIIQSLSKNYKDKFNKSFLSKIKKKKNYRLLGMGGSTLGSQAIYQFFGNTVKNNFEFIDNLQSKKIFNKKKYTNLIISKSGNTIETIVNANILIKKKDANYFITENKKNYLHLLAKQLKADVIEHNNFIGGRYSVLSEVGMLPAELMGLKSKNFRQFNSLINNKKFTNSLINNVASTVYFIKKRKFNSVIINYDEQSENLFKWYQQLISESLGKKNKGLLPIVSNMPKDNHSVMQLYLDGFKNNFYTFFIVKEKSSEKINNKNILKSHNFLKNKKISDIMYAQKKATETVFKKKNLPFRSFEIMERNEKTLGELFCFFILETILLGRSLKVDPFDQPAVELIKTETKKNLI